jgi:hypothetical protein
MKSPLFVKYMVLVNEKTKIDVSLGAFNQPSMFAPSASLMGAKYGPTSQQHLQMSKNMTTDLQANTPGNKWFGGLIGGKSKTGKEDKEAELETLRNVKVFLTAKLKQNEEVTGTLQKDIGILKEILRVEKSIT